MQPSSPGAGAANQNISPTTHCKTASGQVQLKSAAAGGASGSSGSSSGTSGMGSSSGASGSTSGTGSISGVSPSIVATLPNC